MMLVPRKEDALHKMQLYRLLTAIVDKEEVAGSLCFKGGTCAAMLGYLDRFSVDLAFDLMPGTKRERLREKLHKIFAGLGMEIKDESESTLLFFLRYPVEEGKRNTIKLDAVDYLCEACKCRPEYLADIDRYMNCQSVETMFANKLVAFKERYERKEVIAGRNLYDLHHFFMQGYAYSDEVIKERRGVQVREYLEELVVFVEEEVTQTVVDQDLNTIISYDKFRKLRKIIKQETLALLTDELKRLG